MADKAKDKEKEKGKGKGKGKKAAVASASPMGLWTARARGIGGIIGFLVAYQVCRGQGFAQADAIIRGLGGAIAMSLVAWWSCLMVIQALMRSAAAQAVRDEQAAAAAQAAVAAAQDAGYGRRPSAAGEADFS